MELKYRSVVLNPQSFDPFNRTAYGIEMEF